MSEKSDSTTRSRMRSEESYQRYLEYQREWRRKYKTAYTRAWYKKHPNYSNEYYATHREQCKEYSRKQYYNKPINQKKMLRGLIK